MNRFLAVSFVLSAVFIGNPHAQAQFPAFPDSNAVWRTDEYDGPNFLSSSYYHMEQANHDSLINGEWYSLVWHGLEGQDHSLVGGLREDSDRRVYFYHANTDSTYLLYDFDPAVGDSMEIWVGDPIGMSSPSTQWMYVDSIVLSSNNNGTTYKVIGIMSEAAILGEQGVVDWWIEGVGGSGGLFTTIGSLSVSVYSVLGCMFADDTLWPLGTPGECWPTGIVDGEPLGGTARFHPTITADVLYFDKAPVPRSVEVFNTDGRLLYRTVVNRTILSVAHLPQGSYMLRTVDESGRVLRGRFIKE